MSTQRHIRVGPRAVVVYIFVLAMTLAACSGAEPEATGSTQPAATGPSVAKVLDAIVLAEDAPPTGTEFAFEDDGAAAGMQPAQASAPDIRDAILDGLVDSLIRLFFTPEMFDAVNAGQEAVDQYAAKFDRSGHWSLGSWASEYENPGAAASALDVILVELRDRWGLRRVGDAGLGDEGAIFGGRTPIALGTPTTIYFWRSGPYLLQVVAHGSVKAGEDEIRSIAEGMQSRVPAT